MFDRLIRTTNTWELIKNVNDNGRLGAPDRNYILCKKQKNFRWRPKVLNFITVRDKSRARYKQPRFDCEECLTL